MALGGFVMITALMLLVAKHQSFLRNLEPEPLALDSEMDEDIEAALDAEAEC